MMTIISTVAGTLLALAFIRNIASPERNDRVISYGILFGAILGALVALSF